MKQERLHVHATQEASPDGTSFPLGVQDGLRYVMEMRRREPDRLWCIVGKGPSCDRRQEVDWSRFYIVTLNHACRVVTPHLAFFVDYEAFAACLDLLEGQGTAVLPWRPHVQCRPGQKTLADYALEDQRVRKMWREGRLLGFNARPAHVQPHPQLNFLLVLRFSAVPAFHLLASAGVPTIHSLGVDGGTQYGRDFDKADLLRNGRASFDDQFEVLLPLLQKYRTRWLKLPDLQTGYEPA